MKTNFPKKFWIWATLASRDDSLLIPTKQRTNVYRYARAAFRTIRVNKAKNIHKVTIIE